MSKVRRIHQGKDQWEDAEQPLPTEGEKQDNGGRLEHDLRILEGNPQSNKRQEEEDEELMELMYGSGKRAERGGERMEEEEQYVP